MFPGCIRRGQTRVSKESCEDLSQETNTIVQIYTDWANHYLEKTRSKRRISTLATDCSDGILLADIIESVINHKVPDINRKPKSSTQMLDNINSCLCVLRCKNVPGIESITATELREGRLKAVLSLFFALSRFKQSIRMQQQQQQQQQQHLSKYNSSPIISIRHSENNYKHVSNIPQPGSVLLARKGTLQQQQQQTLSCTADNKIPKIASAVHYQNPNRIVNSIPVTSTANLIVTQQQQQQQQQHSLIPRAPTTVQQCVKNNNSMLEKIKLFRNSDKSNVNKRVSGSSNFSSSNRSEKSDGSMSSLIDQSLDSVTKSSKGSKLKQRSSKSQQVPTISQSRSPVSKIISSSKVAADVEKHAQKIANLSVSKMANRLSASRANLSGSQTSVNQVSTGIPKPTAAIKGTTKQVKEDSKIASVSPAVTKTQTVALISPMPVNKAIEEQKSGGDVCIEKIAKEQGTEVSTVMIEDDATVMNVVPMKPLVRGYSNNLTFPNRTPKSYHYHQQHPQQQQQQQQNNYNDLMNGYLSENESVRESNFAKINDINDGYLSEGGVSVYSKKIHHVPNGFRHPRVLPNLGVLTEQQRSLSPVSTSETAVVKQQALSFATSASVMPISDSRKLVNKQQMPHRSRSTTPQSFGYQKRNGQIPVTSNVIGALNGNDNSNKNGQVISRTKVKVSDGTQTCSSDLQQQNQKQYKSYSLTGNTANQLSQSIRERLISGSQSLPKSAGQDFALMMRHHNRSKISDGSLSDTQVVDGSSPYGAWIRHSNTYSVGPRLSETDSLESLTSLPSHRNSLTQTRLVRDPTIRLSRSNSISSRSSKSDKFYQPVVNRHSETESDSYYCLPVGTVLNNWSQPSSPGHTAAQVNVLRSFPLSPTHSAVPNSNLNNSYGKQSHSKDDEVHGSSISLISTASSIYSSAEEKHAHEIRKLRKELREAHEKVYTLTSQLKTNAHVVSAFEQSLTSMSTRLQNLTATSEKKDSELAELRTAMENLRAQSVQAGLVRQMSSDSVSSLSSACSVDKQDRKKKKGWLRSSFTKAFSRTSKISKIQTQAEISENESGQSANFNNVQSAQASCHILKQQSSPQHNQSQEQDKSTEVVAELQKQLREKDMVLTDIRLEALSSAHQLESLKDTVMKMKSEMMSLKQNNERLQRIVGGCTTPINIDDEALPVIDAVSPVINDDKSNDNETDGKNITLSVYLGQPQCFNRYYIDIYENDLDSNSNLCEMAIGQTKISNLTTWSHLDEIVKKTFRQHINKLDPTGALGLSPDAVARYRLGEAERIIDHNDPDLLPVGYTVGKVSKVHLILQPIAAFTFESLIPRGVAQRLVSLLSEQKRIVFCGASGTGKSYLANRLAEFYTYSQGRDPAEAVVTFNVDNKSNKELKQYLSQLSDYAISGNTVMLPSVVILDNLHRIGNLSDCLGTLPRSLPCLIGTMIQVACNATSLQLQHGFRWVHIAPHMEPTRGLLGRVLQRRLISYELSNGPKPEIANVFSWLPRVWQHINSFLETHNSGDVAIGPRLFLSCPVDLEASRAWFADIWNYSIAPCLKEAAQEGLRLYGRRAAWIDPTKFILDTYPWVNQPAQNLVRIGARDVGLETNKINKLDSNSNSNCDNNNDPLLNMLIRLQEAANYSNPNSISDTNNGNNSNDVETSALPTLQRI